MPVAEPVPVPVPGRVPLQSPEQSITFVVAQRALGLSFPRRVGCLPRVGEKHSKAPINNRTTFGAIGIRESNPGVGYWFGADHAEIVAGVQYWFCELEA